MIITLVASSVSYLAGVVSGVFLSEHKLLTTDDIRGMADRLIAKAPKLQTEPPTQPN